MRQATLQKGGEAPLPTFNDFSDEPSLSFSFDEERWRTGVPANSLHPLLQLEYGVARPVLVHNGIRMAERPYRAVWEQAWFALVAIALAWALIPGPFLLALVAQPFLVIFWPRVEAEVVRVDVAPRGRKRIHGEGGPHLLYAPEIFCDFWYENKLYQINQLYQLGMAGSRKWAETIAKRHRVGTRLKLYVCVADPGQSVGHLLWCGSQWLVFLLFIVPPWLMLFVLAWAAEMHGPLFGIPLR
jgi:hypothetical protein